MVRYGILHCHSENSLHDSPMHVETLVNYPLLDLTV